MLMMLGLLARNGWKVPTDAHDAGPFGPERLERSQLMLIWAFWPGTAGKVPTDAHDVGPFGPERLERSRLMLMMLGLLTRNAWKGLN